MSGRLRRSLDVAMLALTGGALLAIVVGAPASIRWPVVFAAVVLVPGSAIMTLIPVNDVGGWLGLAVALSLGVGVVASTVTLWLGWWHPLLCAAAIAVASCVAFVLDLRSLSRATSVSVA